MVSQAYEHFDVHAMLQALDQPNGGLPPLSPDDRAALVTLAGVYGKRAMEVRRLKELAVGARERMHATVSEVLQLEHENAEIRRRLFADSPDVAPDTDWSRSLMWAAGKQGPPTPPMHPKQDLGFHCLLEQSMLGLHHPEQHAGMTAWSGFQPAPDSATHVPLPREPLPQEPLAAAQEPPPQWPLPQGPLPQGTTSVIVRNIPSRCSQDDLIGAWPPGSYDLLHMPFSSKQRRFAGYCFVNFGTWEDAEAFRTEWHGKKCEGYGRCKVLSVKPSHCQGLEANLRGLKREYSATVSTKHLPAVFDLGSGDRLDFREVLAQVAGDSGSEGRDGDENSQE